MQPRRDYRVEKVLNCLLSEAVEHDTRNGCWGWANETSITTVCDCHCGFGFAGGDKYIWTDDKIHSEELSCAASAIN